jgi:hypothetical protein
MCPAALWPLALMESADRGLRCRSTDFKTLAVSVGAVTDALSYSR